MVAKRVAHSESAMAENWVGKMVEWLVAHWGNHLVVHWVAKLADL